MEASPKSNAVSGHHALPAHQSAGFFNLDIGSPQLGGSAKPVEAGWDLTAGGADIWEKSDQFHFLCKEISGDFDIAVRVESFTPAHLYSKAGLMIRETLNADSPHLMFLVFAHDAQRNNNLGAYEMQLRSGAGGDCQAVYPVVRPPAPPEFPAAYPNSWLRVERREDQFSAFASRDGKAWKLYAAQTLALASKVYVGPALTSHNPQVEAKARFRDYAESK
ncbi:Pectate lyase (fragment) [Verrucomicrobia bacterium]